MIPCQSAGKPCPREGTVLVRIDRVGDRRVCPECAMFLIASAGIARRLDEPVVTWRQRDLRRDFSGAIKGRVA